MINNKILVYYYIAPQIRINRILHLGGGFQQTTRFS